MNVAMKPAPIRKTVQVQVDPRRAFEVFTGRMHAWWPREHSLLGGKPRQDVVVEPRQGGRWFETATDGSECTWGHVITWEPPSRVLLAWQLDGQWKFNPDFLTEV
ncbi:MAG TPA: ATPase, partial [Xanthobacteraceae bacterium]|nr:ATPase [Xanthobacteraceae bacterium]